MSSIMQSWKASAEYADLFSGFLEELQRWCKTGKEPKAGNQDIKYYLDLQEKRLRDHNLVMKLTLEPDGDISSAHQITSSLPILYGMSGLSRFNQSLYFQLVNRTVEYYRDMERIFKKKKFVAVYQVIIDPEPDNNNIGETTYVCPNCGAISTLDSLQNEGCPYCKTRYLMKDLYPKIANYYTLDNPGLSQNDAKKHKKIILTGGAAVAVLGALMNYFGSDGSSILLSLLSMLMGFPLGVLITHMGMSFYYLGRLFCQAGQSLKVLGGSAGSKKKITRQLSPYDPSFSYEYFEGKALSLARIIMLNDDLQNCVQYQGPNTANEFSDIIDIQYRGGFGVDYFVQSDNRIQLSLRLYLTNTLEQDDKIADKDETVHIEMYHYTEFPVDTSFSIVKVQCPSCGGSFDARKEKCCPYCDRQYDAGLTDWIVTRITRSKR